VPGLDNSPDPLIRALRAVIRVAVKGLAVLMTLLIVAGVIDVGWTLFDKMVHASPMFVLTVGDILATFGAFMAVLIAIEILINITLYLRDDVIHVKIVMATALMAMARKVIILDLSKTSAEMVFGIAAVILSTSVGYWLISRMEHQGTDGG
jgi:uncharacterized membrane protein (DUF373 family)